MATNSPGSATTRNVGPLIKFGLADSGNLNCSACDFIEIEVPPGYNKLLAHLVLFADKHNREVHPDGD